MLDPQFGARALGYHGIPADMLTSTGQPSRFLKYDSQRAECVRAEVHRCAEPETSEYPTLSPAQGVLPQT
jgi:hypothetical protein